MRDFRLPPPSGLFWHVTRCIFVIIYRRFGTFYKSHFQGSSLGCLTLEYEPTGVPETSINNCQYTPLNIPEERIFHVRGVTPTIAVITNV